MFSPASSVDYGSFADRCSTWLELLRLKAHTIRRGSVKTSRRTQSLAHSGDHTHKYRTQFHKQLHTLTHRHTFTHPSMHAAGGAEHCKSSTCFLAGVWTLKPRPSEGSTISSLALRSQERSDFSPTICILFSPKQLWGAVRAGWIAAMLMTIGGTTS